MKTVSKKVIPIFFALALVFSTSAFDAQAATSSDPTVKIKKSEDTSVMLRVNYPKLKNKSVKIKVRMENKDTDKVTTVIMTKRLTRKGIADVKIGSLSADVEYSFKVAVKRTTDNDYSSYSNEVSVNSGGSKSYAAPEISVSDVSSTSVDLEIASAKLKNAKVKIKVRVENNDSDDVSSLVFTKKLNRKGKVILTISNLSPDTEYSFKAMIKKSSASVYSDYSSEETQKTDD